MPGQLVRKAREYLAKTGIVLRELAHGLDIHDLVAVEDDGTEPR
ncbi:MAG: hypothetical protein WBH85_12840 [Thermoanaerobaculia bacterium]